MADALGDRIAAKWVGHVLLHHRHDTDCVCHRVVRVDGRPGNYIEDAADAKRRRLEAEGVVFDGDVVRLERHRFRDFVSERPLVPLRQAQESLAEHASARPLRRPIETVAGVDVSYRGFDEATAAYVLFDSDTGKLIWQTTRRRRITFPYITSYLAFRELPLLIELIESARAEGRGADVLLVDGSGMLHPRRAGMATYLGVLVAQPTVGVTKKLLSGQVDLDAMRPLESRSVRLDGVATGVAIRPTAGSHRPIFVSPGHGVDPSEAETIVRRFLLGRRLPEPLYWADRLSRDSARRGEVG